MEKRKKKTPSDPYKFVAYWGSRCTLILTQTPCRNHDVKQKAQVEQKKTWFSHKHADSEAELPVNGLAGRSFQKTVTKKSGCEWNKGHAAKQKPRFVNQEGETGSLKQRVDTRGGDNILKYYRTQYRPKLVLIRRVIEEDR